MTYGTINADVIQTSTSGGILGAGNASIMKNRIINGAMVIDQRNAGASVTPADAAYTLDRWMMYSYGGSSKFTCQQNAGSVTPPTGFAKYMGFTSTSAYSIAATNIFGFHQRIEGFNTYDLGWGTANAKTVTLSFQVYSSLTGTFGGSLMNGAGNRSYPFSYTVSSANTWTPISITITGDTSGTWIGATNGIGIEMNFSLGVGSTYSGTAGAWAGAEYYSSTGATSVVGTSGATFYITGVQLEVGSSATGFEYRQYTTELNLCQRYYWKADGSGGFTAYGTMYNSTHDRSIVTVPYHVTMRTNPSTTITYGAGTANTIFGTPDTAYVYVTVSGGSSSYLTAFAASAEL